VNRLLLAALFGVACATARRQDPPPEPGGIVAQVFIPGSFSDASVQIHLTAADGRTRTEQVDACGTATFRALRAGSYSLVATRERPHGRASHGVRR
jgi:hypothetical protein